MTDFNELSILPTNRIMFKANFKQYLIFISYLILPVLSSLNLWGVPKGNDDLLNPLGSTGTNPNSESPNLSVEFETGTHPIVFPDDGQIQEYAVFLSRLDTKQVKVPTKCPRKFDDTSTSRRPRPRPRPPPAAPSSRCCETSRSATRCPRSRSRRRSCCGSIASCAATCPTSCPGCSTRLDPKNRNNYLISRIKFYSR